jgi:hypothetical protein
MKPNVGNLTTKVKPGDIIIPTNPLHKDVVGKECVVIDYGMCPSRGWQVLGTYVVQRFACGILQRARLRGAH